MTERIKQIRDLSGNGMDLVQEQPELRPWWIDVPDYGHVQTSPASPDAGFAAAEKIVEQGEHNP
jgi:hypothetical protein